MEPGPAPAVLLAPASPAAVVATTQEFAAPRAPLSVAPTMMSPATASPARKSQQTSLDNVTYSYFGPVADQIVIIGQLQLLRDAEIETTTRAGSGPRITRRSQTIDVRRWEAREAEKRREQNSDRRTRRRRSNTGMRPLGAPADKVVSRPPWRWPAPLPRRLRSHRLAGPRAHHRSGSSTGQSELRPRAKFGPMHPNAWPQNQRCREGPIASHPPTRAPPAHCSHENVRTTADTASPARKARAATQA